MNSILENRSSKLTELYLGKKLGIDSKRISFEIQLGEISPGVKFARVYIDGKEISGQLEIDCRKAMIDFEF